MAATAHSMSLEGPGTQSPGDAIKAGFDLMVPVLLVAGVGVPNAEVGTGMGEQLLGVGDAGRQIPGHCPEVIVDQSPTGSGRLGAAGEADPLAQQARIEDPSAVFLDRLRSGGSHLADRSPAEWSNEYDRSWPSGSDPAVPLEPINCQVVETSRTVSQLFKTTSPGWTHNVDMALARLGSIALDCDDPSALAAFWAELVGGEVAFSSDDFVAVKTERAWLAAVRVPDYQPPSWPGGEHAQAVPSRPGCGRFGRGRSRGGTSWCPASRRAALT